MKVIKIDNCIYSLEGVRRITRLGTFCIRLSYSDGTFDSIGFNNDEAEMCESCFNTIYEILKEK